MPLMPCHEAPGISHTPNYSGASKWGEGNAKRPFVVHQEIGLKALIPTSSLQRKPNNLSPIGYSIPIAPLS